MTKKDEAYDVALAELEANPAMTFAEAKDRAAAKSLELKPLTFARAKRKLGIAAAGKKAKTTPGKKRATKRSAAKKSGPAKKKAKKKKRTSSKRVAKSKKAGRAVAVKAAAPASTPIKRKRGRPKGSTLGGSKSAKIRELLASGKSVADIAKSVGCSVNLVYAVKRKAAPTRMRMQRAVGKRAGTPVAGMQELVAGLRELEAERNALRAAAASILRLLARFE